MDPPLVEIDARFRKELREQGLPRRIRLSGEPWLIEIAKRLLASHAPHIVIDTPMTGAPTGVFTPDASAPTVVHVASMEEFGAAFVRSFLEERDPPAYPTLLYSIPEPVLRDFARKHNIPFPPVATAGTDDVRALLDRIAAEQPQTYYSLSKSALRLKEYAEALRRRDGK
jgi:hypothetical protein